jgi:hypothetical protein
MFIFNSLAFSSKRFPVSVEQPNFAPKDILLVDLGLKARRTSNLSERKEIKLFFLIQDGFRDKHFALGKCF